jgi:hypothetical protein
MYQPPAPPFATSTTRLLLVVAARRSRSRPFRPTQPEPRSLQRSNASRALTECYGRQASQTTKRLLPAGSRVRLFNEPATDRVDPVRPSPAVCRPRQRRGQREHPARRGRCRCAVLLQRAQRPLRGSLRVLGEEGESEETRALGSLPTHPVQPLRGRPNASLNGFAAPLGDIDSAN